MTLEDLRKKVLFHNSIDVWIEYCGERSMPWKDAREYGRFIKYLQGRGLGLKTFNLCAHEAGETESDKKGFAESLANLKASDPAYATYTIRLGADAVDIIREFH